MATSRSTPKAKATVRRGTEVEPDGSPMSSSLRAAEKTAHLSPGNSEGDTACILSPFTWAPHIYTEVEAEELSEFHTRGRLRQHHGTPNGKIHRRLTAPLEHLGDPFQPFIYGQKAFPMCELRSSLEFLGDVWRDGEVEYVDKNAENRSGHDAAGDLEKHLPGRGPLSRTGHGIDTRRGFASIPCPSSRIASG